MKNQFIGAVTFSAAALCHLVRIRVDVVGVRTLPRNDAAMDNSDLSGIASESATAIRALAQMRNVQSKHVAAESFMLMREQHE